MKSPHTRRPALAAALVLLAIALTAALGGCSDGKKTEAADKTVAAETAKSGLIVVGGLVDYPMTLTVVDLDYMDWIVGQVDHPDLGTAEYEGAPLSQVFLYVGVHPEAKTVTVTSSDGASVDITLEDIAGDNAILAVAEDGAMNMVLPGLGGEAWATDVVAMEFK